MERQRQPSTDAQQTDFSCLDTHLKLLVLRCCEPPELVSFALTCKELHSLAECAWPEQLRHHYRLSVSAIQGPSSRSVSQALFRLLVQHGLLDRSRLPSQLLPGSAEGRRLPYHVRFQALYTDGGVDEDLYQRYWADLAFEANGWGAFCSKVSPNVNVLGLLQAQSPGEEAELSRRQFLALATRMAVGRLLARVPLPRREEALTPRQERFFAKAQAALLRWPTLSLLRLFCLMYQHRRAGSGLGSLLDTALLHHLAALPQHPPAPPPSLAAAAGQLSCSLAQQQLSPSATDRRAALRARRAAEAAAPPPGAEGGAGGGSKAAGALGGGAAGGRGRRRHCPASSPAPPPEAAGEEAEGAVAAEPQLSALQRAVSNAHRHLEGLLKDFPGLQLPPPLEVPAGAGGVGGVGGVEAAAPPGQGPSSSRGGRARGGGGARGRAGRRAQVQRGEQVGGAALLGALQQGLGHAIEAALRQVYVHSLPASGLPNLPPAAPEAVLGGGLMPALLPPPPEDELQGGGAGGVASRGLDARILAEDPGGLKVFHRPLLARLSGPRPAPAARSLAVWDAVAVSRAGNFTCPVRCGALLAGCVTASCPPAPPPSAPPPSGPHSSPVAAALAAAEQPGHAYLATLTGQPACSALEGLGCASAVFAEVAAGRLPRVVQHRLLPQGEVIEFAVPPPPPAPAVAAGRAPMSADSSAGPLPLHPVMWFRFFTRQEVEAPSPLAGTLPRMRRMLNACAPSPRTWPWGRPPPALLARHQALLAAAGELRCALQGAAPAPLNLDAAASRAAAAKRAGRGRAAAEPGQPRQLRSRTRDAGSSSQPAAAKASAAPSSSGPVRAGRAGAVRSGGRSGCAPPAGDEAGRRTALDEALAALHVLPDVAWSSTGQQRVLGAAAQPESGRRSGRGGAGGRGRGGASCEATAPTGCCATQRGGEAAWAAASPQVVDSDGLQPLPAVPQQLVVAGAEGALEAVPVAGVLAPGVLVGGQRAAWDWLLLQAQAAQQRVSGGEAINPYAIPCEVWEEHEFWECGAEGGGRGQQGAGGRGGMGDDEDEDSLLDTSSESDSLFSSGFAPAEEGGILGFVPAEDVEELLGMMGYDEGMLQPQGQQPGAAAPAMAHAAGAAPAASPSSSMDTSQFSSADSGSEELGDDDDDDEDSSSDGLDSLDELDEETLNLEFAAQFPDIVETLAPSPAEHALVVSLAQLVELSTLTQTHLELEAECRALVEGGPSLSLARPAAPGQLPPGQQGVVLAAAQGIHLLPGDETASDSYAFQIAHSLEQLAAHPGLLQLELLTPRAANLVCLKLISPEDRMREMHDAHDAPNVDIQFVAFRGVSVQLPRDMVVV